MCTYRQKEAVILDLRLIGNKINPAKVPNSSGFANNGIIITAKEKKSADSLLIDKDCYVEVPNAYSLDNLGSTITMMAWVYPKEVSDGLVDLFSKGDNHVCRYLAISS
ncbi:MAG: hypothetical protein ABIO55_00105 [Ginsengibacter sp.]